LYSIESGVALGDCSGHLGRYLRGLGLRPRRLGSGLCDIAAGLCGFGPCLPGLRACTRRFTVRLRYQHLSMSRIGLLAGTRDSPAGDTPERETHHQATNQRHDRHTVHGGDLAGL
jgi:hypothetical protein